MLKTYPLDQIIIVNGRNTSIKLILEGKETPQDDEELALFEFCRSWFSEQQTFKQQTSGSTGKPQTIHISRKLMTLSAEMTNSFLHIKTNDINLVCLSVKYIAGKMMLVRALINQQKFEFISPSANPLLNAVSTPHFAAFVPYQLQHILENTATAMKVNAIDKIITGGAPISLYLENLIKEHVSVQVYHTFGMTETVSHIALRDVKDVNADYKALEGIKIGQTDDGRLTINAPLTDDKELITNDIVKITSPTSFKWIGRADHVINSGGVKLQIEVLEQKIAMYLQQQKRYKRLFIFSKPNNEFGEMVCLAIEGESFDINFNAVLKPYEIPKEVHFILEFEETPTQKIDRKATIKQLTQS